MKDDEKADQQISDAPVSETVSSGLPAHIEQAALSGCISTGTLDELASTKGIPLACTTTPSVVIVPKSPGRDPKYRLGPSTKPGITAYEGAEHSFLGNSITLKSANGSSLPAVTMPLVLPNGLSLLYGQILALAGDFYGVPSAPISDGTSPADIMTRFTNAYNTLATASGAVTQAPAILNIMATEITAVNQALMNGQQPSTVYKALGDSLDKQYNVATGGGCLFSDLYPMGTYLQLAAVNWDHFGQNAITCYSYGHTVAMNQAVTAKNAPAAQQDALLQQAYAMNAFADHFLSDAFSSGHTRTPRKELYENVTPNQIGSLLARYMHDEDSKWGLSLKDLASYPFHAYGDKRFFDTVNYVTAALTEEAIQASANEVYSAFTTGNVIPIANMQVLQWTPNPIGSAYTWEMSQAAGNISPMFVDSGSSVQMRNFYNNLNSYGWTSVWTGWLALSLLETNYNPPPPQNYPQPPTTAPAIQPNGWQSTTSSPPWVAGAQVRYAVSFTTGQVPSNGYESEPGPWSPYVTVAANQAVPTLTVPLGPAGTAYRYIYRQFSGQSYSFVGSVGDNTTTTFIDRMS